MLKLLLKYIKYINIAFWFKFKPSSNFPQTDQRWVLPNKTMGLNQWEKGETLKKSFKFKSSDNNKKTSQSKTCRFSKG